MLRLDKAVMRATGWSRSDAKRLILAGGVCVAGRSARKPGLNVEPASVEVDRGLLRPVPSIYAAEVAASDADAVIAVKPAGLPVHPLTPGEPDSLLQRLLTAYPEVADAGAEGPLRGGLVHRLDTLTSGLVACARHPEAWQRLRGAFKDGKVLKQYIACVAEPAVLAGEVGLPVRRWLKTVRHRPARVAVVPPGTQGGRPCGMTLDRLEGNRVWITLGSGHLHQIRVMLADLGAPILGDDVYGGSASQVVGSEQATLRLHAWRLGLPNGPVAEALPPW